MIRKMKQPKSLNLRVLSVLGKLFIFTLRVLVSFIPDERIKVRYTAAKAQQLYEDGVITGSEFAKHIDGD